MEIDWGAAEGQPTSEMEQTYPGRSFPGARTPRRSPTAAIDGLEALEERYPGKKVLVVAHGT